MYIDIIINNKIILYRAVHILHHLGAISAPVVAFPALPKTAPLPLEGSSHTVTKGRPRRLFTKITVPADFLRNNIIILL